MLNTIMKFFMDTYNLDLSDSKIYYLELIGRKGFYNYEEDMIVVDSNINSIDRELTLVHELTHRMVYLLGLITKDEEAYCKEVTLDYVRQEFNEVAVTLLKDYV